MSQEPHWHHGHHHHHAGKSSEGFLDKAAILKELAIFPGEVILDAGCGNGYMSKEFSRLVTDRGKVYALDPDEPSIAALQQEVQGTNITAILGDVSQKTPIPDASLDLVYLSAVFHGFSPTELDGFKQEDRRLLKPKGMLAVIEIVKEPTPFGPPLEKRFSPEELRQVIPLAPKKLAQAGQYFYLQLFEKLE